MSEEPIDEAVNTTNMKRFLELLPHIEQPKINEERNKTSLLDKALDKYNKLKENYFIDFILTINSEPTSPIDPIVFNIPRTKQKEVTKIKDIILGRVKQLSLKKKRKRNARKTATKNISKLSNINRRQARSKNSNTKENLMNQKEKLFQNMIRQLENAFKKGLLTNEQFDKFKAEILVKVLTNREKGGII